MYFYNKIKEISKKENLDIFVDMDGVIAAYDFGNPLDFLNKRPLKTNIKTLECISKLKNVNMYILSVCRKNSQINEKNKWLEKYAPFFKKENRNILSKEVFDNLTSAEIKLNFLKHYKSKNKIIVIDDDNLVLNTISKNISDIILFQDSELID